MSHHNEIFVHTDRGEYIAGDVVYGTVYLSIHRPVQAHKLFLEIKGYEKAEWVDHRTEFYDDNGVQKSRTVSVERKGHRDFFKDGFSLVSYPGTFPQGQFAYPFQYRLPTELPGVFEKKKNKDGNHLKAKIVYKVKAVLDIHGKDLKAKQHLYINQKLDTLIQPKHYSKTKQVRTLCCIPRGPISCEAWLDKNAYMCGETANVHVVVKNDSSVQVNHFTTKLIREIKLRDNHGNVKHLRDIVCQQKYPGAGPHSSKESDIPLLLVSKKKGFIKPGTTSKLITCEYFVMIEMEIPWAPDLEIYAPTTIYAPQNAMWAQWNPPSWIASANTMKVCAEVAVPQEVLDARMHNGQFAPPPNYNPTSAPPPSNNPSSRVSISSESTPLLH